jgi:GNAT superfamily N-acetyltransferase
MDIRIDAILIRDWLTARSLARGLPQPVADHGGYRVDTNGETEIRRWVFPRASDAMRELAHRISEPGHFVKLCGTPAQLRPMLPPGWQTQASGYMMAGPGSAVLPRCPPGYTVDVEQSGPVSHVKVISAAGELAASGYSAETGAAFVYDRIATAPAHQRKGLGTLVMATLRGCKLHARTPELLVATEAGCMLYRTLGWRILSPYATGSIPHT